MSCLCHGDGVQHLKAGNAASPFTLIHLANWLTVSPLPLKLDILVPAGTSSVTFALSHRRELLGEACCVDLVMGYCWFMNFGKA